MCQALCQLWVLKQWTKPSQSCPQRTPCLFYFWTSLLSCLTPFRPHPTHCAEPTMFLCLSFLLWTYQLSTLGSILWWGWKCWGIEARSQLRSGFQMSLVTYPSHLPDVRISIIATPVQLLIVNTKLVPKSSVRICTTLGALLTFQVMKGHITIRPVNRLKELEELYSSGRKHSAVIQKCSLLK